MNALTLAAVRLAAGGMLLALAEVLLPHAEIRSTARIAFGLLFLELLTEQIIGIIP